MQAIIKSPAGEIWCIPHSTVISWVRGRLFIGLAPNNESIYFPKEALPKLLEARMTDDGVVVDWVDDTPA